MLFPSSSITSFNLSIFLTASSDIGSSVTFLTLLTSLESSKAMQMFALRESISRSKQLLIEHPESILANTFMFHLYDMKIQLFPFSNDQDLDLMIFYLDKVINKSKKYIESSNMDFLDIMCIGGLYDEKNKYSNKGIFLFMSLA